MQGIDNQIIIKNFPIRIYDLIEKINISFLKKNFKEYGLV